MKLVLAVLVAALVLGGGYWFLHSPGAESGTTPVPPPTEQPRAGIGPSDLRDPQLDPAKELAGARPDGARRSSSEDPTSADSDPEWLAELEALDRPQLVQRRSKLQTILDERLRTLLAEAILADAARIVTADMEEDPQVVARRFVLPGQLAQGSRGEIDKDSGQAIFYVISVDPARDEQILQVWPQAVWIDDRLTRLPK